jgi:hypothetical protein
MTIPTLVADDPQVQFQQQRVPLDDLAPVVPDSPDARAILRSRERRRTAAALIPGVALRFTWRSANASDALTYDRPSDSWQWPVSMGATLELRAIWRFDDVLFRPQGVRTSELPAEAP